MKSQEPEDKPGRKRGWLSRVGFGYFRRRRAWRWVASGQVFLAQRDFEAALDAFDTAAETFIDAIAADPYEDTPRLAFAWFHSDRTTSGRRF